MLRRLAVFDGGWISVRAAMAKKKRSRRARAASESAPLRRPKRKTFRRLLLLLMLLGGAASAAPTIVAHTALRNQLLSMALPAPGWRMESQAATFGWSGNQSLTGVTLIDPAGQQLLTAASITCERSLLALAANWRDLGKVQIDHPTVYLMTRSGGSNIEDLLAALVSKDGASGSDPLSVEEKNLVSAEVEIVAGTLRGLDTVTQQQWSLTEVNLVARLDGVSWDATEVAGSATMSSSRGGLPGKARFRLQSSRAGGQQLDLLAEALPLEPLEPWLARALPGAQIAGRLTIDAPKVRWILDAERGLLLQTSGQLQGEGLVFTADALEGDRLVCQQLSAPWQLTVADNKVTVGQLEIDAGWSKFTAQGALGLDQLSQLRLKQLPQSQLNLAAEVALDRLAAMLPRTLKLREGVRIDRGALAFQAGSKPTATGVAWTTKVSIQNVIGSDRGRAIRWERPIELVLALVSSPHGPKMEQLSLKAPFANAQFATGGDEISGSFQFDLDQFSQELGQFVDFEAWQLRGRGVGHLALTQQAGGKFDVDANLNLTNLQVAHEQKNIWTEPQLRVAVRAAGTQAKLKVQRISAATIGLEGAGSVLDLQLLQPVDFANARPDCLLQVEGQGPLAPWVDRLRPWMHSAELQLSGEAKLRAKMRIAAGALQVTESHGSIAELGVRSAALSIDEPHVAFSGDVRWDPESHRLDSKELQLIGNSVAFRSRDLALSMPPAGRAFAEGQVAFRADLERLAAAFGLFAKERATWPRGTTEGQVQLASDDRGWQATFSATGGPLHLLRRHAFAGASPEVLWTEPRLRISGKAVYEIAEDRVRFENLHVNGQTLQLSASPQFSFAAGSQQLFLPSGPLLTRVQVSRQVSQTMLKYIAPVVASATHTEGEFSVRLSDSRVPLANPQHAQVTGLLEVHRLSVVPGPMLQELATAVEQLKALADRKQFLAAATRRRATKGLTITDRNIDFEVHQGRVYHRNLEFVIDGVPVRSHGSVGFDQTLALVFEIPIQKKWLGEYFRSLAGHTLTIPVSGSFDKWKFDLRAVADLSQHALQGAASQAIGDELNRQLEKLFQSR